MTLSRIRLFASVCAVSASCMNENIAPQSFCFKLKSFSFVRKFCKFSKRVLGLEFVLLICQIYCTLGLLRNLITVPTVKIDIEKLAFLALLNLRVKNKRVIAAHIFFIIMCVSFVRTYIDFSTRILFCFQI